ncbi:hypothetical protein Ahia01_000730700 [Argonauta hians]
MGSCWSQLRSKRANNIFVLKSRFKPTELTHSDVKAALLIQRWFRGWAGKLEVRRRVALNIFQGIEYFGEQDLAKLSHMFQSLIDDFKDPSKLKLIKGEIDKSGSEKREDNEDQLTLLEISSSQIPANYRGIRITKPYSSGKLKILVEDFRHGKIIHAVYVSQIMIDTIEKLKQKETLCHIRTSLKANNKVTIVGDIHGNLNDLLTIFHKNNLPSTTNPYLFNGDIVDRGPKSVEVCMIIFYSILVFPNHVFLNRGNHEDYVMNRKYGFTQEIIAKFRHHSKAILKLYNILFKYLPLASTIDDKIFVTHGGISDSIDLMKIQDIPRKNFVSILRPGNDVEMNDRDNWEHVMDLLWSDPKNPNGCYANDFRSTGKYFGPDVTEEFLRTNGLLLIIRSHECKPNGYEYTHNRNVLTIFSSSNYYEDGSNKGAYIIYNGDINNLNIIAYVSNLDKMKTLNIREQTIAMETSAFSKIKQLMRSKLPQLKEEIRKYDPEQTGLVTAENFCKCLSAELPLKITWHLIVRRICEVNKNGMIDYKRTFSRLEISNYSVKDVVQSNREILESIFRTLDADNSGNVTMEEFINAMEIFQRFSDLQLSKEELQNLGQCIDVDKDGMIDINEFFEAFRLSVGIRN